MVHVNMAHEIWTSLETIHETKDYQIAITIQCALFSKCASKDEDMIEHLAELKKLWEHLNVLNNADFHIMDIQFKTIITSSLPSSWDVFTKPYVGRWVGVAEKDPKKLTSSQEFIGILKEEYMKRKDRNGNTQQVYHMNTKAKNNFGNQKNYTLGACAQGQNKTTGMLCCNCKLTSHVTDDYKWLGQPLCDECNWFGHVGADCCHHLKCKWVGNTGGTSNQKKLKKESMNAVEEQTNVASESKGDVEIVFVSNEVDNFPNNNSCNTSVTEMNEESMILCYWLADSATTSHVTNRREIFNTYELLTKIVSGIDNVQT